MSRRSAKKKFRNCPHKSIEYGTNNEGLLISATLTCPKTEDEDLTVETKANQASNDWAQESGTWTYADGDGKKHDVAGYKGQNMAFHHLSRVAGAVACDTCPLAKMTPLQVSNYRVDQAQAQRAIAQNDLERWEAIVATQEADQEVAGLRIRSAELRPQQPPTAPGPGLPTGGP